MPSTFHIALPRGFRLPHAVASYGYFMLAPNVWDVRKRTLHRPLRGERDRLIRTRITQPAAKLLRVACDVKVTAAEREMLRRQIARILRLDEEVAAFAHWHRVQPDAKRLHFGRLFRSATLFEDIVKTMTGCNVTWPNTIRMNALLCEHVGGGGFPTPAQLAAVRPLWLKRHCKVGYRADRIIRLAKAVANGKLDLSWFEDSTRSTEEIFDALHEIHGIGDYAAGNLCMLLGRYDRLAIDTETYRHFRQHHKVPTPDKRESLHPRIEAYYARFAPFQFLAYWFELWTGYEERFGKAHTWNPKMHGQFTAAALK